MYLYIFFFYKAIAVASADFQAEGVPKSGQPYKCEIYELLLDIC